MKIEHKLSEETAAFVTSVVKNLEDYRAEYLKALGQAKEHELNAGALRNTLQTHLGLIERAAKLPRSLTPYVLSPDGTKLIGEVADPPAEVPAEVRQGEEFINGHAAEAAHHA